jgi:hypothetical protein
LPEVWRSLAYGRLWVHVSGNEWVLQEFDGEVVIRRDHWRRTGFSCSCTDEDWGCRHLQALKALVGGR